MPFGPFVCLKLEKNAIVTSRSLLHKGERRDGQARLPEPVVHTALPLLSASAAAAAELTSAALFI